MVRHHWRGEAPLAREVDRGELALRVGGGVLDDREAQRVRLGRATASQPIPGHAAADYLEEVQLVDQDALTLSRLQAPRETDARALL